MWRRFLMGLLSAGVLPAGEWIDLWPGEAPGAPRPAKGTESVGEGGRYQDIEVPQYQIFQPEKPNGRGVVIFAGGGYRFLSVAKEGVGIAEWCVERGMTAMVVKYRVDAGKGLGYQFPVPLLDARRAIRTMRAKGLEWGVNKNQIGVLGASAGGHLASMCATLFEQEFEEESEDEIDAVGCCPDFVVLMYPVIGVGLPWGHGGSSERILGKEPTEALKTLLATHLQVSEQTPPVFIVHSADDKTVPLKNATEFANACAEQGVPVRAAIYPTGGHGFGGEGRGAAKGWLVQLEEWFERLR